MLYLAVSFPKTSKRKNNNIYTTTELDTHRKKLKRLTVFVPFAFS